MTARLLPSRDGLPFLLPPSSSSPDRLLRPGDNKNIDTLNVRWEQGTGTGNLGAGAARPVPRGALLWEA